MAADRPLLAVDGLKKSYGQVEAVKGLSFEVFKGETVVIMGPSGCGKSTTIRCINRLTEPDSGTITFDGIDMTSLDPGALSAVRRRMGFVFQGFNLVRRLSCLDNVALGLVSQGVDRHEARRRAMAVLERVGMARAAERTPDALSGGQRQRVGIARALVSDPELMLWDEPTASLDPILVGEVLDVMEELAQARSTTMVVVTHELAFARRAADKVILMDEGRIVEEGSPAGVFGSPKSELGRKYQSMAAKW